MVSPASRFGDDPWTLVWDGLDETPLIETIFSLANGFVGVRASFEQGQPAFEPGSLVNGFHETWPISYPEAGYGYATVGQTIVYVPDATGLAFLENEKPRSLSAAEVTRLLNLRKGTVTTRVTWPDLTIKWERLVSLTHRHVMAIRVEGGGRGSQYASGWRNRQETDSLDLNNETFDPRRAPTFPSRVLSAGKLELESGVPRTVFRTMASELSLAIAADHGADTALIRKFDADELVVYLKGAAVEKRVSYVKSDDSTDAATALAKAPDFAGLAAEQEKHLQRFWESAGIAIGADARIQQAVNWIVFQLHQASARIDGTGIPAKGLSGQGYEGHYFWDSEIFLLPFLAHTDPQAAARLIAFRHSCLPRARERAQVLSHKGALFPWRTITGEEASSYFEAGTAQYHINADIVYGIDTYFRATADDQVLINYGIEIAIETARLWADLGHFHKGAFHFSTVTGPDEYSAMVDDNAYTNLMARFNLERAANWTTWLESAHPERFAALSRELELDEHEIEEWSRLAASVFVPYSSNLNLTIQDAQFLDRKPWDWNTPRSKYPLLLNFHPLVIYRHQVIKQADVVLAMFLLPDLFSPDLTKSNFDFYDPLTTGDSSLSPPIQAAVAARLGYLEKALTYFEESLFFDLEDRAGNTADGIHLAAAGGAWQALVGGFGGFSHGPSGPRLDPRLPPTWTGLDFNLRINGSRIRVSLKDETTGLVLLDGEPVQVSIGDEIVTVNSQLRHYRVPSKWI